MGPSRFPAPRITTTGSFSSLAKHLNFDTLLSRRVWERPSGSFGHVVPHNEAYYGIPERITRIRRGSSVPFVDTRTA